jgi:putative nucleotidyltransferase with HDIG domain
MERAAAVLFDELNEARAFADWIESGGGADLLVSLIPDMALLKNTEQNGYHRDDVWTHSMLVLREIERLHDEEFVSFEGYGQYLSALFSGRLDLHTTRYGALRLAALLHDLGKPEVKGESDGRITFIDHERAGAEKMEQIARTLDLTGLEQDYVTKLIRNHLRPLLLGDLEETSHRAISRLIRAVGEHLPDLAVLSWADVDATRGTMSTDIRTERHHRFVLALIGHFRAGIPEKRRGEKPEKRPENS